MCSYRAESAAAVDAAEHLACFNPDSHIAAYNSCRQGVATEATTSTKDVTINVTGAPSADDGVCVIHFLDVYFHIAPVAAFYLDDLFLILRDSVVFSWGLVHGKYHRFLVPRVRKEAFEI